MKLATGFAASLAVMALLCSPGQGMAQAKPGAGAKPAAGGAGAKSNAGGEGGGYAQRFATECAACHGANGKSEMAGTPNLAGQHSYYAVTQLFLFREGRRNNEAMTAVARSMKDDDLRGFSDFIGTLPPVPAAQPDSPPDAARMSRGQALAQERRCLLCHGPDLSGGQQVPRIAGQREEYLRDSLQGFRTGKRSGYTPAMLEPLNGLTAEDVDTLAYFVAHLPAPASRNTGK